MKKKKIDNGFLGGLYYRGNLVVRDPKTRTEVWYECPHCGKISKSFLPEWQKEHLENIIHEVFWKIKTIFGIKKYKPIDWKGFRFPKNALK